MHVPQSSSRLNAPELETDYNLGGIFSRQLEKLQLRSVVVGYLLVNSPWRFVDGA